MKKTTLLLILLTAVCANAEWKFDNDPDVQERGDKRDEEREEARKALERVRFGVKAEGGAGGAIIGEVHSPVEIEGGIMLNFPLSRLSNGNLVLATELNCGVRSINNGYFSRSQEAYLSIPLMFQYVSFFYPTSDIQVHWVPSPKRHVFMHLKTIMEAGAFIDIPLIPDLKDEDRNFLDPGVMVGSALQLESVILGARVAASYTDFGGGSTLLIQLKAYLGYLF